MSYTAPEQCTYPLICIKNDTSLNDTAITILKQRGPFNYKHEIHSDYSITLCGAQIPIVKTDRMFTSSATRTFGSAHIARYVFTGDTYQAVECTERPPTVSSFIVSEDCTIEKSVLLYLDHRYGVCLYRYQKDTLTMAVDSDETAYIKDSWGVHPYFQAQIKTNNYNASRLVEYRLVINGIVTVLKTTTTVLHPFGLKNDGLPSGVGLFPDYEPDADTRMVLIYPPPPSLGEPWSEVLCRLGCYEFGYDTPGGGESEQNKLDGGNKDHYYPEWCRSLHVDPFWRKAADNRYQIDWFHAPLTNDKSFTPEVSVDPLPIGSYVNHPVEGETYQFLCDGTVATSPDLLALIDEQLALAKDSDGNSLGLKTHDTTLYYPIGVI